MQRRAPWHRCLWWLVLLATHYSLLATSASAQTVPKNVQKSSDTATINQITADLKFGNGRTLSFLSGSTLSIAGTLSGTPTGGTLDLSALTLTLGAQDGSLLTALNATQLTSGTLPDARFPSTLPALNGSLLTALNATQLTSGTVSTARLYTTAAAYNITNGATLDAWGAVTDSAGLAGRLSDETGTGALVFAGSPTFTGTPILSTTATATAITSPAATNLTLTANGGASLTLKSGPGNGAEVNFVTGNDALVTFTDLTSDNIEKNLRLGTLHYSNAEEPVALLFTQILSSDNVLNVGGGTAAMNASTFIDFWTATTRTTVTGTRAMRVTGTGNLLIGGTTDISGIGGIKTFGGTAPTNTTSGANQFVAGIATQGPAYVGGNLSVNNTISSPAGQALALNTTSSGKGVSFSSSTGLATFGDSVHLAGGVLRLTHATANEVQSYTGAAYTPIVFDAQTFVFKTSGGTADLSISSSGDVSISAATPSTNTTSGALVLSGANAGLGVAGAAYIGSGVNVTGRSSITKDSTYTTESSEGLAIISAASDSKIIIGADATNDIAFIQSMQSGTSFGTRPLWINAMGGNTVIGAVATPVTITSTGSVTTAGDLTVSGGNVGIGSAASTTTAVLLPASSTTVSPIRIPSGVAPTSPVTGDLWYSGTNLVFRDGSTSRTLMWGAGLDEIDRLAAQFDATTTTLGGLTGLSVAVTAGTTYRFKAVLHVNADATGGHKYAVGGTATATSVIYQINSTHNTTNAFRINSRQTALGGSAGEALGTGYYTLIEGTIVVGTGGTLEPQFAQNSAVGTSSVLAGSTWEVIQL